MANTRPRCDSPAWQSVPFDVFGHIAWRLPDWLVVDARKPEICEQSLGAVLCRPSPIRPIRWRQPLVDLALEKRADETRRQAYKRAVSAVLLWARGSRQLELPHH
jgi:hypothetical protein